TIVIALISGVTDLIRDSVEGQLGLTSLYAIRTETGYLAAGIAIITYHVAVLRQDNQQAPAPTPPQTTTPAGGTITLVGPLNPSLATSINRTLHRPVQFLATNTTETWNIDTVIQHIQTHDDATNLLIIAHEHGIETRQIDEIRHL